MYCTDRKNENYLRLGVPFGHYLECLRVPFGHDRGVATKKRVNFNTLQFIQRTECGTSFLLLFLLFIAISANPPGFDLLYDLFQYEY